MSAATLLRRPHHAPLNARSLRATPKRPKVSTLEQLEDELIARAIPSHPGCDAALDGVLNDMAWLSAEVRDSRRRPLLLRSTTQLNQVEDLLLEAVIRTHPNREHALDRLMDDLAGDETTARTEHDNDFDGMR